MKTLKMLALIILVSWILIPLALANETEIMDAARRASVQTVFKTKILKISFTTPLKEQERFDRKKVDELLDNQQKLFERKVEEAIDKARDEWSEDKYEESLTTLEKWNYKSKSKTFIPLGALAPKNVKFPERVIVATKIEKTDLTQSYWEKEYEKDVLAIAETLETSPTKARALLGNLKAQGYSVNKEEIKKSEDIELLYFATWDTSYPTVLDWKVYAMGEENNLIIGYHSAIGVLETRPIPEDKSVYVKASYYDLKDKFKEKPAEVKKLEEEKKSLETQVENLREAVDKALKKDQEEIEKEFKRDIRKASIRDIFFGIVKIEPFEMVSEASGIFLGNMQIREEMGGFSYSLRGYANMEPKTAGVILTNAHCVDSMMMGKQVVSDDNEIMWIFNPSTAAIRYTIDSDRDGSPAMILEIHDQPIVSNDVDAAILVTSAIPGYEKNKAILGNSDNVREGDPVVTVGNPIGAQKMTSKGVVASTDWSFLDQLDIDYVFKHLNSRLFRNIESATFWLDTPIGYSGCSGSGVWALNGSEVGKVIAIRNKGYGVQIQHAFLGSIANADEFIIPPSWDGFIINSVEKLISLLPNSKVSYDMSVNDFIEQNPTFSQTNTIFLNVTNMNGAVPINKMKAFLQERGLDPEHFGWQGVSESYWRK